MAYYGNMSKDCQISSQDDSIECTSSKPYERLFKLPLGTYQDYVVADIKIGVNPKYGAKGDSDFYALLCDSNTGVGFVVVDVKNYRYLEPCFHVRGTTGETLTNRKTMRFGPLVKASNPYPQEYNFLISTHQQSGACITATAIEGKYTTAGYFNYTLPYDHPLSLEIYGDNSGEKYNFRYIAIDIDVGW